MEDIPEALRDQTQATKPSPLPYLGMAGLGLFLLLAGGAAAIFWWRPQVTATVTQSPPAVTTTPEVIPSPLVTPTPSNPEPENLLNHLKYEEAPLSELKPVSPDGKVLMRETAAAKFLEMQAAAQAEGIILVPLSGFRTFSDQERLFFEVKEERGEVTTKRAEVSAPPGYSEHHTGYAMDIGDGSAPATHINLQFEQTAAFRWLQQNAAKYSFELSFPKDNLQGISYEPWHWRFVGNPDSLETFYKARNLTQPLGSNP